MALNQLWLRAERAHQAFLETHQNRKRYVDSFDRAAPGELAAPDPSAADLPRTRMQKAVDEFEERRSREAFYSAGGFSLIITSAILNGRAAFRAWGRLAGMMTMSPVLASSGLPSTVISASPSRIQTIAS